MHLRWIAAILMLCAGLSGCLGGDDAVEDETTEPPVEEGKGTIEGTILTQDLEVVVDALITLSKDAAIVADTRTDEEGRFQITNIEPDTYRLHINAPCCLEKVMAVDIAPDQTNEQNHRLDKLTDADLKVPTIEKFEWSGAVSCGFSLVYVSGDPCSGLDDNANASTLFELHGGVKTVVAGVVWKPTGGVLGEELGIGLHPPTCSDGLCDVDDPADTYAFTEGASPLILRVDSPSGEHSFDRIEDSRTARLMVLPAFGTDVYYQQPFTVYYHIHYHQGALEGYNPIPDI